MREIKFRAWDIHGKKMLQDHEINYDWLHSRNYNNYTPMQFIGVKDKFGKDIYDGDIMKVSQRTIGKGKLTKRKDFFIPVEFYNGGFHLPFINYGEYRFRDGDFEHYEVVGNIYENQELL